MTEQRHYTEAEISAIFEHAIDGQEAARQDLPNREGLTLDELKKIGSELGITDEYIAQAAAKLDTDQSTARRDESVLSVPYAVERIIPLPRAITDREWDHLVVDLRETFKAKGKIERSGSLRQWTNGNLQALIEPSGAGYRLRLRTRKGSAKESVIFSGVIAGFGLLLLMVVLASETVSASGPGSVFPIMMLLLATLSYGYSRITVSRWHQTRSTQMDQLAARLLETVKDEIKEPVPTVQQKPLLDLDDLVELEEEQGRSRSDRLLDR